MIPFLKTSFALLVAILLFTACSSRNEIDCVKDPKSAVNKSFSVDGKAVIFATKKSNDIYDLEDKLNQDVEDQYKPSQKKYGDAGAVADIATHTDKYLGIVKNEIRRAQSSGQVTNINLSVEGKRTKDPLELVVVAFDHAKSRNPTLKVRAVNKRCAGAEVWILARDLYKFGHLIDFSHR